jgi:hypothetical protein
MDEHPGSFWETKLTFFGLKLLKFFDAYPDLESGILSTLDRGSGMEKVGSGILGQG